MKFPWTFVAVLAINSLMAASNINGSPDGKEAVNTWSSNTEVMVKERLQQVPLPFEARVNGQVMGQIRRYVTTGYRDAELILGRAKFYFPIFEHYLRLYDLPEELKYLPIVESGLRPYVHSGAGAAGLWQMMYHTGRYYKLTINDYVDERMDPYRSTEAAVRMLSDQLVASRSEIVFEELEVPPRKKVV
ncbi:MAG: transglycosylase SLT domain-containing protein [Saprospiraceae bacterium]|nr:transglycosylase SLT domain-containing protein [Saprospiraceae bacterium]